MANCRENKANLRKPTGITLTLSQERCKEKRNQCELLMNGAGQRATGKIKPNQTEGKKRANKTETWQYKDGKVK